LTNASTLGFLVSRGEIVLPDPLKQLSAELFYRNPLRTGETKPAFGLGEADPERSDHTGYQALILDGREKPTSLEREGFKLLQHSTMVEDFYNDQDVQSRYYAEIKEVALKQTGAAFAQVLSHITRSEEQALSGQRLGAHRLVHNDFTPSLKQTLEPLLGQYDIEKGRICVFNLWRRFDGDALHAPLAVCDASSVTDAELIPTDLHNYGGGEGFQVEIYQSSHNPGHRWFYFPKMHKKEVLMFKTYDSAMDPFMPTLHSAFDDPNCPEEVSLRESIEVRVMCFYV